MPDQIKRILGWVWMLIGPLLLLLLIAGAVSNISESGTRDINKPLPWFIIILVFIPIAAGLMIFGYYCIKGEYDRNNRIDL